MQALTLSLGVVRFALWALGGVAAASLAQSASPAPLASGAPPAAVVHVKNFTFVPDTITIAAGQTVRFVEDDETAHTVTATDKSFDSGNLEQHDTWDHTFAAAGTYAYICTYHTYMKGTVTVR